MPLNGNCTILDSVAAVGALAVTTTEIPSASLNIHVAPGTYRAQNGAAVGFPGVVSQSVTESATNYIYLDLNNSGTVAISIAGWPATAHVRLALVVSGSASIGSIADERIAYSVVGPIVDGTNFTFGSVTGTQFGTAPNQKLGFFGQSPTARPTMGAATAASTYGNNEQVMLQVVYNALRALGLGS